MQPSERPFDDPAIAAELLGRLDALAGDPGHDAAQATTDAQRAIVVGLVGMKLPGATPRTSARPPDGWHGIDDVREPLAVGYVRCRHLGGERDAVPIDENVVLAAKPASVSRIGPSIFAPLFAGTIEVS